MIAFTFRYKDDNSFIMIPVIIEYVNTAGFIERRELKACIDTGANQSCIDAELAGRFEFTKIGVIKHQTANGIVPVGIHTVNIILPNDIRFDDVEIAEMNASVDFVIGLDILNKGDFIMTHKDGYKYFSFRSPTKNKGERFVESTNEYKIWEQVS